MWLGHACTYMPRFILYSSMFVGLCVNLMPRNVCPLGAEGTGGGGGRGCVEGEAWTSFTVYYSRVLGAMHVISCVQGSAWFPSL